jgi:prepilin-type N-terminal cleavage/methylation domain-containing protein
MAVMYDGKRELQMTRGRAAFTLLEMLTVIAIMGLIMSIAVVAFVDIGRGAAMRSSVLNVRSGLSSARQYAITHRVRTLFEYGNASEGGMTNGYYVIANSVSGVIGVTNFVARGICFADSTNVEFALDGSCTGAGWANTAGYVTRDVTLYESRPDGTLRPNGMAVTTVVYKLTGRMKSKGWVED